MKRVSAAILVVILVRIGIHAQPPQRPQSTATITGRVIADDSGSPIANARVTLVSAAQGTPVVLTDTDGRFTLAAPSPTAGVAASKPGYGRREVAAAAGTPVDIRLQRGAAISGRVVDEFGEPVVAARVAAHTASSASANQPPPLVTAETDDHGEYRLATMPAGSYIVSATTIGAVAPRRLGPNQIVFTSPPYTTYYPGGGDAQRAQPLSLEPGDDRPGIDFVVSAAQSAGQPLFSVMQLGPQNTPIASNPTRAASAVIRGRVVSTGGRSLPYAQVRLLLRTDLRQSVVARADGDGRFEFGELPAGRFLVIAAKTGYSRANSQGRSAVDDLLNGGQTVDLAEGEIKERVDITLAPWGSISGRVFDELGEPVQRARVNLLQVRYEAGRRRLVAAASVARLTDDLGRYRLYAAPPGRYIVTAAVSSVLSAELPGYVASYFPGTANASQAQFVPVAVSQEVVGIDFSLSRAPTFRIAGQILDSAGVPTMAGSLMLVPYQSSSSVVSVGVGARISNDGRFEFPNVPAGQYIVRADRGRRNGSTEGEFAAMPVAVVNGDVTNLLVQTSAGSSVRGRFTFDRDREAKLPAPAAFDLRPVAVDADHAPASVASADIDADWTFEMSGINGRRRLHVEHVPDGWSLKEIRINGVDATDRPLTFGRRDQSLTDVEVVLTDRITELSGTTADATGRLAPNSTVIVFPTDRDRRYPASRFMRIATADADARFKILGLPFGTYHVAAVSRLPSEGDDAWQDAEYLETLSLRASSVTLREGQATSLTLRIP